ncbi:MAG: hypothetical protein ACK526_15230 [Planctomyces sp.]
MIQNGVEYDLAFLRPLSWLRSTGAAVGGSIHMELHEMGLNIPARVVGIDPCPIIEPDNGTGRNVVTGTMAHSGANIVYLDITGLDEPLGVTDTHPIWMRNSPGFRGRRSVGNRRTAPHRHWPISHPHKDSSPSRPTRNGVQPRSRWATCLPCRQQRIVGAQRMPNFNG